MNETVFFIHIFLVVGAILYSLKKGPFALVSLIALQGVLANLFVVKQMKLFGFDVTCSDVFAVGGLLSLNLLQEFFGRELGKKAITVSFLSMIFFAVMTQVHLQYIPSDQDYTHESFLMIFSATPRIILASITVYLIVQQLDLRFFSFLQKRMNGKNLPLRLGISLCISQLIDTVLFSYLGLYGMVPSMLDIIAISLATKWMTIACSTSVISFAKKFIQPVSSNGKIVSI